MTVMGVGILANGGVDKNSSLIKVIVSANQINNRENIMSVSTNMDLPVKQGGTRIRDFEDLRIAFLDLQKKHNDLVDKHNALANDYRGYRNEYEDRDINDRTYGL